MTCVSRVAGQRPATIKHNLCGSYCFGFLLETGLGISLA